MYGIVEPAVAERSANHARPIPPNAVLTFRYSIDAVGDTGLPAAVAESNVTVPHRRRAA